MARKNGPKATGIVVIVIAITLLTAWAILALLDDRSKEPEVFHPAAAGGTAFRPISPLEPSEIASSRLTRASFAEQVEPVRRLIVLRRIGRTPIDGAVVMTLAEDGVVGTVIGTTAADGVLQLPSEFVAAPCAIWVEAFGFAGATVAVSAAPGLGDFEVVLTESARITGRVRFEDGVPVKEGMVVLGWPTSLGRPSPPALASGRIPSAVRRSQTRSDGSFVVDGTEPGAAYYILTGGSGVAASAEGAIAADAQNIELKAFGVFCTVVRLRDAGETPRTSPMLVSSGLPMSFRPEAVGAFVMPDWSAVAVLAGADNSLMWKRQIGSRSRRSLKSAASRVSVEKAKADGSDDRFTYTWFVLKSTSSDRIRGIPFSCQVPGYRPIAVELEGLALSDGIRPQDVSIERIADDFGVVEVRVSGLIAEVKQVVARIEKCVEATFFDTDRKLGFSVFLGGEPESLTIPVGNYVVSVEVSGLSVAPAAAGPNLTFSVGAGRATELAVDGSSWSAVSLALRNADGSDLRLSETEFLSAAFNSPTLGLEGIGIRLRGDPPAFLVPTLCDFGLDVSARSPAGTRAIKFQPPTIALQRPALVVFEGVVE